MKTLAPWRTIQADLIIEMTLSSTQDPNWKCLLPTWCVKIKEDQTVLPRLSNDYVPWC